ncbi:class I SAM-dependent methyltransferase [Derxia gummosa]|uniref:Class I SAM-dependent methyltransferase n=1 Tax=Derxia gummosa DSM 723 TaxID=1121388 RepID=A0A9U5GYP4_9BURK|nr:methyltransferase domain-containing protein [Derxia gummosa]
MGAPDQAMEPRGCAGPPGGAPDPGSTELARFFDSARGRYLLAWEQHQFDMRVGDIFGFNAGQLGLPELDCLRTNRMPFVFATAENAFDGRRMLAGTRCGALVESRFEALPFASQSIDLLALPHTLDFSSDPHQVLREVERVIAPEGRIVITGFNPFSFWGLSHMVARAAGGGLLPPKADGTHAQFMSLIRLKDWLKLLNFEIEGGAFGCYRPPVRTEGWLDHTRWLEPAGDRWWPVFGGVYLIVAVKRVAGMRIIGPAWKSRAQAAPSLAAATRGCQGSLRLILDDNVAERARP